MAIEPKTAALIPAGQLSKVVDEAIHAAGLRIAGPVVLRWDLAGKVVRDFAEGQKFSEGVVKHMNTTGAKVVPAVLQIDKHILAGFYERDAVPQIRNL